MLNKSITFYWEWTNRIGRLSTHLADLFVWGYLFTWRLIFINFGSHLINIHYLIRPFRWSILPINNLFCLCHIFAYFFSNHICIFYFTMTIFISQLLLFILIIFVLELERARQTLKSRQQRFACRSSHHPIHDCLTLTRTRARDSAVAAEVEKWFTEQVNNR